MAKYLKLFENHTQYEQARQNLILPNISLCAQENDVHYNPYVDPYAGHEYVDLGLPSGTKWATMNVGASSETDYGNYYQYGKGAGQYAATSGQNNYSGTEDPLAASADTAVQEWGGLWHMPTRTQLNELTANTNYSWTTINGVNGGKFTSETDSSKYIFLPAAGYFNSGSQSSAGSYGNYWSSYPDSSSGAYRLSFSSGSKDVNGGSYRYYGFSVRPVVG